MVNGRVPSPLWRAPPGGARSEYGPPRSYHAIPLLKERYRLAAARGDWAECMTAAQELPTIGLRDADAVETAYAIGLAHERLGHVDQAKSCYETVLMIDRRHIKALKRLRVLSIRGYPPSANRKTS